MQLTFGQLRTGKLSMLLRRFQEWWLKEFLNLFPERVVAFIAGRQQPSLVLRYRDETIVLELLSGSRAPIGSALRTRSTDILVEVDRFLKAHGIDRKDVELGLRLPADSVFCRQLLLPAEAIDAVDAIVAQDLAKKTPFKPADIYSDHVVVEHGDKGGKLTVWQWVIRRHHVEQALLPLGVEVGAIAFIVFDGAVSGQPEPRISLRSRAPARASWWHRAMTVLCGCALGLALLAGGLKYWNQQTALDRIELDIASTSKKAQHVRALVDQLREQNNALLRLRLQRSVAPRLIDLWQEATRVLPPHSWLTEFRLIEAADKREGQVALFGFSNAAPSLVGLVDGSPLFFDAALTAPIAVDASEGRERFALQAKVRQPDPFKEAAR
jgi:general secretion pathway protein L